MNAADEALLDRIYRKRYKDRDIDGRYTEQKAETLRAIRQRYPHLRGGELWALVNTGNGPESPVTAELARLRARKQTRNPLQAIGNAGKGLLRGAFTAAEGLWQAGTTLPIVAGVAAGRAAANADNPLEVLGGIPGQLGGAWRDTARNVAVEAVSDQLFGGGADLGTGFFAGGDIEQRVRDARETEAFAGMSYSPGRFAAYAVSEPGTKPYNLLSGLVDAGYSFTGDAGAALGGASAKLLRGRRTFTQVDVAPTFNRILSPLLPGLRKSVDANGAQAYLASRTGQRLKRDLAAMRPYEVFQRLDKTGIDSDLMLRLGKEKDEGKIGEILATELGREIARRPGARFGPVIERVREARILQDVPGRHVYWDQHRKLLTDVDGTLTSARVNPDTKAEVVESFINATRKGATPADRKAAQVALSDALADRTAEALNITLKDKGDVKSRVRDLVSFKLNWDEQHRAFNVDDIGQNKWFSGVRVTGKDVYGPTPHLVTEGLATGFDLPDPRDLARATSKLRWALENNAGQQRLPVLLGDWFTQQVFKPMVLLRLAWPIRVIGDEQARMGAAGYDSMFTSPLSVIAWALSGEGKVGRAINKLPKGKTDKGSIDVLGEAFANKGKIAASPNEFAQAMSNPGTFGRDLTNTAKERIARVRLDGYDRFTKGNPGYERAWGSELLHLYHDPVVQRVVAGESLDAVKEWFFTSPAGRTLRRDLRGILDLAPEGNPTALMTRKGSDEYIDSIVERIATKTKDQPDLIDAIRTGKWGDNLIADNNGNLDPDFVKALRDRTDGPEVAIGPKEARFRANAGTQAGERIDAAVRALFGVLMTRPSNWLSRQVTFKQDYWNRQMVRLMPHMTDEAKGKVELMARKAKLSEAEINDLARAGSRGTGTLDLERADLYAKAGALQATQELLYDVSRRGRWADASRIVYPFAEAWKEVITTWGRLGRQNPQVLSRTNWVVDGARGSGFFYTDEQTGQEMFAVPGSEALTRAMAGVDWKIEAPVAGLSIAGGLLPGINPLIQFSANGVLPDEDWADSVMKVVSPFGSPGVKEVLAPAWARKVITGLNGPDGDRLFANTVTSVATYLVSTGEFTVDSPEAMERTLDEARKRAKALTRLRGFVQYGMPSAPSFKETVHGKDEKLILLAVMKDQMAKFEQEDYDTAPARFLQDFGPQAILAMESMSTGGAPPTDAVAEWAQDNPDIRKDYPSVYGFFAPEGGEFNNAFYDSQIRRGERKTRSTKEVIEAVNSRLARMVLNEAKANLAAQGAGPKVLGGGNNQQAGNMWLADLRAQLVTRFPGYQPEYTGAGKLPQRIRELERAADDPRLRSTEVGLALATYLEARTNAAAQARSEGIINWQQAKRTAYLRDWLRGIADQILVKVPDFDSMWGSVLSNELSEEGT